MKNKLADAVRTLAVGLILGVVMVGLMHVPFSKAQSQERRQHEVVLLWVAQDGISTPDGFAFDGAVIYCSSSSEGAPKFPQQTIANGNNNASLSNAAQSISLLLNAGYELRGMDPKSSAFILVK